MRVGENLDYNEGGSKEMEKSQGYMKLQGKKQ